MERLIVIVNLPYLPKSQKRELAIQVTKYEPLDALFAEKKGRALNEQLIKQLHLLKQETDISIDVLLELDPSQAVQFQRFSQQYFSKTKILHDLHDRARFLKLSS